MQRSDIAKVSQGLVELCDNLSWRDQPEVSSSPWTAARPLDHSGGAGLLWAINGGRLVELHRDWAVIELAA
ncbi:MAG TPA: hypothetical protein VNZ53_42935, partial [Steroidobacteraceae bacterium]|nr:hypothetical protein [Steroidobacteraceae bacterium]